MYQYSPHQWSNHEIPEPETDFRDRTGRQQQRGWKEHQYSSFRGNPVYYGNNSGYPDNYQYQDNRQQYPSQSHPDRYEENYRGDHWNNGHYHAEQIYRQVSPRPHSDANHRLSRSVHDRLDLKKRDPQCQSNKNFHNPDFKHYYKNNFDKNKQSQKDRELRSLRSSTEENKFRHTSRSPQKCVNKQHHYQPSQWDLKPGTLKIRRLSDDRRSPIQERERQDADHSVIKSPRHKAKVFRENFPSLIQKKTNNFNVFNENPNDSRPLHKCSRDHTDDNNPQNKRIKWDQKSCSSNDDDFANKEGKAYFEKIQKLSDRLGIERKGKNRNQEDELPSPKINHSQMGWDMPEEDLQRSTPNSKDDSQLPQSMVHDEPNNDLNSNKMLQKINSKDASKDSTEKLNTLNVTAVKIELEDQVDFSTIVLCNKHSTNETNEKPDKSSCLDGKFRLKKEVLEYAVNKKANLANVRAKFISGCLGSNKEKIQEENKRIDTRDINSSNSLNSKVLNNPDKLKCDTIATLKLIILHMNDEWKAKNQISLMTEVRKPEELIDAVYCSNEKNCTSKCTLFTFKYLRSETNSNASIKLNSLATPPISVRQLFSFYKNIKEKLLLKNVAIENFTIYTNLDLNENNFKQSKISVIKGSKPDSFKINVDKEKKIFKSLLENYSVLISIAKIIAELKDKSSKGPLLGVLEKYHLALINDKVIHVLLKNGKTKIGKFHKNFVNDIDLSSSAKELRNLLKDNKMSIQEDIELNLPPGFGEGFLVDENPTLSKIEVLANKLVEQAQISIEKNEKILLRKHQNILEDLKKIAKHVLTKAGKDTVVFTEIFLNESIVLPGNLNFLRESMSVKLRINGFKLDDLKKCTFGIKCYDFVESDHLRKNLPSLFGEDNVAEFFNKLEFIADKTDIYDRIKKILPELDEVDENRVATTIQNELFKWFKLDNQEINPLQEFKNISLKKMLSRQFKFPTIDIKFTDEVINEFISFLNLDERSRMILIESNSMILTKVKIIQALKTLPQESLFINFNVFSKVNDMADIVYTCFRSADVLVIESDNANFEVENIMNICRSLKKIVKSSSHKPSIVIMGNFNRFPGIFKNEFIKVQDSFQSIVDLITEDSHSTLFETAELTLHNGHFKMKSLMNFETFKSIILKSPEFLIETVDGKYTVNVKGTIPFGYDKELLIERRLKRRDNLSEHSCSLDVVPNDNILYKNSQERIVVISADFGCGKSTFFYNLAEKSFTNSDYPRWGVRINLSNINVHLAEIKDGDVNSACFIITNLLKYDGLRKDLFFKSAKGEIFIKLVLFFDGFEELDTEYANFVISLLKVLKNSCVEKILITSSPNKEKMLKIKLNPFTYSLDSFTQREKIQFLAKYLSKEAKVEENDKNLRSYIEYFLKFYGSKEVDLTSSPLLLKMLAEINKVYLKLLPQHYETAAISNYYDLFEITYEKILKSKLSAGDELSKIQKFSIKNLLNVSDYHKFIFENDLEDVPENLRISHITYAEFFAAQLLSELLDNCAEKICCIVDKIMFNASPIFTDCIMNSMNFDNSDAFLDCAKFLTASEYINFLDNLLKFAKNDDIETELLHVAVEQNKLSSLRFFIDRNKDVETTNMRDSGNLNSLNCVESKLFKLVNSTVDGESALSVAISLDHLEIAFELILNGSAVENLDSNLLRKIVFYVCSEISGNPTSEIDRLNRVVERLYILPSVIKETINLGESLLDILRYFFVNKLRIVLEAFLNAKDEATNKIKSFTGISFLNYIDENFSLDEENRLKLLKFLLIRTEYENGDILEFILETALVREQLKTFEYFVTQYPKGYSGFVNYCLRSNRLKTIENLTLYHQKNHIKSKNNKILHLAITQDIKPKTLDFIIDKESSINSKNFDKETPLCLGIKKGINLNVIKHLIRRGADLNATDKVGMYAWCFVIIEDTSTYKKDDQLKIMEYFLNDCEDKLKFPFPKGQSSEPYDTWREEVRKKLEYFKNLDTFDLNIDSLAEEPRLHAAIRSNNRVNQIWARFLIMFGADVNILNFEEKSTLHLAIELKNFKTAKSLLRHGAIFNYIDKISQKIPLQLLEENQNSPNYDKDYRAVLSVLKKAKQVFHRDTFKTTLEHYLTACNEEDSRLMCNMLNCRNHLGYSLLHVCAVMNVPLINQLLDLGVHYRRHCVKIPPLLVDVIDRKGNTPLHVAANKGHKDVIVALLSKNACFELKNTAGKTPLEVARDKNHTDIIDLLNAAKQLSQMIQTDDADEVRNCLKNRPSIINARDAEGKTPIHRAVMLENQSIFKHLISIKNIRVNVADFRSKTPLHYAVERNNIGYVKLLLSTGSILDCRDKNNQRPFDLGGTKNQSAEMLRSIYGLFEDILSDDPQIFNDDQPHNLINYLTTIKETYEIETSTIVNIRDSRRNHLIHYAVKFDYQDSVINLLKNGAIYNAPNEDGKRPVDYAMRNNKNLLLTIDTIFHEELNEDDLAKIIIDKEVMSNCRREGGRILLNYALEKNKWLIINWLHED